jgi:hypothetical protein
MTIEELLYGYLVDDSRLLALLGGNAADPKIYPIEAPEGAIAPYLEFRVGFDGREGEILKRITVMLYIVVPVDYTEAAVIRDRLDDLLDVDDQINLSSSNIIVRNIVKNGGSPDMPDKDTHEVIKVVNYDVLYTKQRGV